MPPVEAPPVAGEPPFALPPLAEDPGSSDEQEKRAALESTSAAAVK
jgi:hypothetical protein